jgi:hypothetical protein
MSVRSFFLKPFPCAGLPAHLTISGGVERHAGIFSISYELKGQLADVLLPSPLDTPVRMNGLWEGTCFEFFLGVRDSDCYWEFNLSPAGHWNVYHFMSYRSGMQEEGSFTALPFCVGMQPGALRLTLEFGLDRIIPSEQAVQVAVSSVIKQRDGGVSFWALKHMGPQPDFHRRESFLIEL